MHQRLLGMRSPVQRASDCPDFHEIKKKIAFAPHPQDPQISRQIYISAPEGNNSGSTGVNSSANFTYGDHISTQIDEGKELYFFGEIQIPEFISVNLVVKDHEKGDQSNILINGEFFDTVNDRSVFLCFDRSGVHYADTIADIHTCSLELERIIPLRQEAQCSSMIS